MVSLKLILLKSSFLRLGDVELKAFYMLMWMRVKVL